MSPKVLSLILKALDANGEAVFSREDISAWPEGDFEEALSIGLLEEAAPATEVVCPGCEEACLEEVHFVYGDRPEDTRAYVICGQREDIGRVPIPLESLRRWAANKSRAEALRRGAGRKQATEPVSMRGFIEQYCHALGPGRAEQLAKRVMQEARRKPPRLELPPTTNKAKRNERKFFRPSDLRVRWPRYKRIIPTLPDLK
jgi:hypothetical protein